MSDIEIARAATAKPIGEIARKAWIPDEALMPYGKTKAKIDPEYIASLQDKPDGKLILVTAITPTPAGEGKTTTSVGLHGGVEKDDLGNENVQAVADGCSNLARHISNLKSYGVPVVVAINRFSADTDAEVQQVREIAAELGATAIDCTHWANGGAGTEELAHHVVKMIDEETSEFTLLYPDDMPLWDKMRTIAQKIYGADDINADQKVLNQIEQLQNSGFGLLPICVAKTQYSFSTDPTRKGAPSGHVVPIREVRLSAGAGFLVFVCGEIMTMPGLPRVPAADKIHIDDAGLIQGLF